MHWIQRLQTLLQRVPGFTWLFIPFLLIAEFWRIAIYQPLHRLGRRLEQFGFMVRLHQRIRSLSFTASLILLLLPAALLFPMKMLALYWMSHHHVVLGTIVFITAKIAGAAFFTRLFDLTESTLRTKPWMNRFLTALFALYHTVLEAYHATAVYRHWMHLKQMIHHGWVLLRSTALLLLQRLF